MRDGVREREQITDGFALSPAREFACHERHATRSECCDDGIRVGAAAHQNGDGLIGRFMLQMHDTLSDGLRLIQDVFKRESTHGRVRIIVASGRRRGKIDRRRFPRTDPAEHA